MVSCEGGNQLVLRTGPSKPKLENLTLCQWSKANLAILHKLVGEGLSGEGIMDYLSYTTRVYQLFATQESQSVFLYDRKYRKHQFLHKFRWGTDVPHIMTVCLRPKALQAPGNNLHKSQRLGTNSSLASHTKEGQVICKLFNAKKGCQLSKCKFRHVCSVPTCEQGHPACQHAFLAKPKNGL